MKITSITFSKGRALWQVFLLYLTTCGLYFFYWFYKTSQDFFIPKPRAIKPFWRTLGLLVPFLNIYLLWKLFTDINKTVNQSVLPSYRYPSLLTLAFLLCSLMYRLPNLYSFLGFSSVLPILLIQNTLNSYWKKEQPNLALRTRLTGLEVLICLVGSLLLILASIGAGLSVTQS